MQSSEASTESQRRLQARLFHQHVWKKNVDIYHWNLKKFYKFIHIPRQHKHLRLSA